MSNPPPGTGRIHLLPSSQFSHLSFSYPLKLLSPLPPPTSLPGLRVVYLLSYGGGLVSGDKVWIDVIVETGATLVVLTQGTTKVMKRRPRGRLATSKPVSALPQAHGPHAIDPPSIASTSQQPTSTSAPRPKRDTTTQTLITTLYPSSSLYLLPSPTACFARSRYTQRQRFDLPPCGTANLVVLDWFTCGREKSTRTAVSGEGGTGSAAETWAAERMEFFCEVWWGEKRGVGERVVLEDENTPSEAGPSTEASKTENGRDAPPSTISPSPPTEPHRTSYAASLLPYTLFTTLLLAGPALQPLLEHLLHLQATEPKIMHLRQPPRLLWSVSILESRKEVVGMGRTGIVRVCGVNGEEVRQWLERTLSGMGELVGADVWERAMG